MPVVFPVEFPILITVPFPSTTSEIVTSSYWTWINVTFVEFAPPALVISPSTPSILYL